MSMWTVGVIVLWLVTLVSLAALIAWSLCRVGAQADRDADALHQLAVRKGGRT